MAAPSTLNIPKLQNLAIKVEDEAIAILSINRPTTLNALNPSIVRDLLAGLQWAEAEASIRVIIISGVGRTYTAGLNLLDKDVRGTDTMVFDGFVDTLSSIQECLINSNKILISAVKGPAPGWGDD
jgi:enoyl-CoA hydratase/carnithine racemase